MAINRGKQWEEKFKNDWKASVKDSVIVRLYDQLSGYKTVSKNPSDFICFAKDKFLFVECKETHGTTLNFNKITQLKALIHYIGRTHVFPGVLIWFIDFDKIVWVPAETLKQMKIDGLKSVNVKMLSDNKYKMFDLPAVKQKVFMTLDYNILLDLLEDSLNG